MELYELSKELDESIRELSQQIARKQARKSDLIKEKQECEVKISSLKAGDYEKAAAYLRELAKNQKASICEELSSLGNIGLQYAMGPRYQMKIEMTGTAKRSSADIWIIKDGKEEYKEDPQEDNGGGIVDLISNAMKLMILDSYNSPKIDGPIGMDEPFKMLSDDYIPAASEFIRKVSNDFGRQLIYVTHNEYFASVADCIVHVTLDEHLHSVITIQTKDEKLED